MQTTGTLAPGIAAVYMADQLLDRNDKNLVFYGLCKAEMLPSGNGKTVQFNRYERLPLPAAPLSEGITPTATPLIQSVVTATIDQWGAVGVLSDLAVLTIKHPILAECVELFGDQREETIDREIQIPLQGSTAVIYATGSGALPATRSAIVAANTVSSFDVRKAVAALRANGAPPIQGGLYSGVHDPYVEGDLNADATFVGAGQQTNIRTLMDFESGTWLGVRWRRSNNIPIYSKMTVTDVVGSAVAAASGLTAVTGTFRWKATRLDPQTRMETTIQDESSTALTAQVLNLQIIAGAPSGTYFLYVTLLDGATGTATLQKRVDFTTGTAANLLFSTVGAPSATTATLVSGMGEVAPPNTAAVNVHTTYITGKNAWGCIKLTGSSLKTTITDGKPTTHDPLGQQRAVGWKQAFKAVVLDNRRFRRIESSSALN
jgi:N4-gp56 family major capsid protein